MVRFFPLFLLLVLLISASCRSEPERFVPVPDAEPEKNISQPYTILDYKNRAKSGALPEWVSIFLESGIHEVEALPFYRDRYIFISRNEAGNFNALDLWKDNFSCDLDFPRLAAARAEARLSFGIFDPQNTYGSFFETLVREVSNAPLTGAIREDDFWIRKRIHLSELESDLETWEFFILLSIDKNLLVSQFRTVFDGIDPDPPPSREQIAAAEHVKGRFFEGF